MRRSRLALVAALAAAAAVAGLLAADLRSWERTVAVDDARFALAEPVRDGWTAPQILPWDPAGRILGVGDDRALRRAVARFPAKFDARPSLDTQVEVQRRRAAAEAALSEVARSRDAPIASQASDLLGVLLLAPAAGSDSSAVEQGLAALETAARLDPANDDAKANLELALRLLAPTGVRTGPNPGFGARRGGRRGAGAGAPGRGY